MSGGLPEGLVTAADNIGDSIRSADVIESEELQRLWHVFSTSTRLSGDYRARRMENFFWRIWSNRHISSAISTATVGRLFERLSREEAICRTPPARFTLFPTTSSRSGQQPREPSSSGAASQRTTSANVPLDEALSSHAQTSQASEPSAGLRSPPIRHSSDPYQPLPPPILKKFRTSSDEHVRNAMVASSKRSYGSSGSSSVAGPSNSSQDTITPISQQLDERSPGPSSRKKLGIVTAATSKAKTRPNVPRKRSSQISVPSTRKSPAISPRILPRQTGSSSSTATKASATNPGKRSSSPFPELPEPDSSNLPSTFALPSASWSDIDSNPRSQFSESFALPSSMLVEKNFREKFVENQKRATSHTSLGNLGKSSSVRFMDKLPMQSASKGKQRYSEVDTQGNVVRSQLQSSAPASQSEHLQEERENAIDDEGYAGEVTNLPKTKSQLSLMIARERRISGSLAPNPPVPTGENADSVAPSAAKDDDDDEYLVMGMGVGQTRIRTGSFKRKGKEKAEDDDEDDDGADEPYRYQSPSQKRTW